jgi:hypothetical protein
MATAFEIAEKRVSEFSDCTSEHGNAVELSPHEAEDCCKCDEKLLLGSEAFRWLEFVRHKCYRQQLSNSTPPEVIATTYVALTTLFRLWIVISEDARRWANTHLTKGHELDNLQRFMDCYESARAYVTSVEFEALQGECELSSANANSARAILNLPPHAEGQCSPHQNP